jgi:3-oxoacyl-[acyl-carrier-protein] synthase-3
MRWDDIHISAATARLGGLETTADAVADGRYDAEENTASGYLSVSVCETVPAVDLAVDAARRCLEQCDGQAGRFALVTHSYVGFQGLDDFATGAHVQSRTVGGDATALEIRQASNGGMAALELAAAYLTCGPAGRAALLTTSDVFMPPACERYRTRGTLFGDGGTALVLSREPGLARLLSTSSTADTTHEGLQTGGEAWTHVAGGNGWPVDTDARVAGYIAKHGEEVFVDLVRSIFTAERRTIEEALADAEVTAADITCWVFPNMGLALTDWGARARLGVDIGRSTWEWGRRVGHLGAGDQFAALAHLLGTGAVRPGDRILLNGAGSGFTFTSAVVEITAAA